MQSGDSSIEVFVLVEDSCTEINLVAVGVSRRECRVIVVLAEYQVLVLEAAIHKPGLQSKGQAAIEEPECICVVEVEVLVREFAYLVIDNAQSQVVVALDERDGRIKVYEHGLGVALKTGHLVTVCTIGREHPLGSCTCGVEVAHHLPIVREVRIELGLHLDSRASQY